MKNNFYIILFCVIFFLSFLGYQNNKKEVTVHTEQDLFLRVDKIRDIKQKQKHIEMPDPVYAIYMSSWVASSPKLRAKLVDFVTDSKINSIVLDIKDYSGLIAFDVDHPLIDEYKTDSRRIRDIDDFIKELHEKNIYVIGRLTVFQDPLLAKAKPEFAFKRKDNAKTWRDKKGLAFIDPQNKEAWEYFAVIAEESYKRGFDEINFDYIRYPSDGNISNLDYVLNGSTRSAVMKSFYEFLDNRLRSQNIPISADLFGLTASGTDDLSIGQNLDDALLHFDSIAPMVYPSHYPSGYLGYSNPAAHPEPIVFHEMNIARERAKKLGLSQSSLRTWIQDFDMGASYGLSKIHAQIKASTRAGVPSFMVWDPKNIYTKKAYFNF